ncbi:hypothetical protein AXX16_4286 [Serratia rubidaea]|nr:hypothetical protein AXX16_4286 [Serratia rubidaea]
MMEQSNLDAFKQLTAATDKKLLKKSSRHIAVRSICAPIKA